MKNLLQALIIISIGLIALKVLIVLLEPRLTFFPSREIVKTPADSGIPYQELSIPTVDGETLITWFLERSDPAAEVVFFHGNGGNLSAGRLDFLLSLYRNGYSVFVFDYRGYGKSSGSPSEQGLYLDCRAAVSHFWKYIHREPHRVVYLGRSLGGVAAASAVGVRRPHGIILEGTFPNKNTLLGHYPLLRFLALFSRYKLSTVEFLRDVPCPVLVIHGEHDRIVPLPVGKKLFEMLDSPKEFYLVKGAGHVDQYLVGGDSYWQRVRKFVETLQKPL